MRNVVSDKGTSNARARSSNSRTPNQSGEDKLGACETQSGVEDIAVDDDDDDGDDVDEDEDGDDDDDDDGDDDDDDW